MANDSKILDWQVVLDDNEWLQSESLAEIVETQQTQKDTPDSRRSRLDSRLFWIVAGAILTTVFFTGYLLWQHAHAGYQEIQTEIEEIVELELLSMQPEIDTVAYSMVDHAALTDWQRQIGQDGPIVRGITTIPKITIGAVQLLDDQAMVQVRMTQPDTGPDVSYRATRYYRHVDDQWILATPNPRFWGRPQTMETDYFQLFFRTKERDTVWEAGGRLDVIYANLRRDLGLAALRADAQKRQIEVVATMPSRYLFYNSAEERLPVLSPFVLTISDSVSDAEILTKAIVHRLVRDTMKEALIERPVRPEWTILVNGIQAWQAYKGSNSIPVWYNDTVTWIHREAPTVRKDERAPTVQDLNLLCRGYDLWGVSLPVDLSIPTVCHVEDWSVRLKYLIPVPDRLTKLVYEPAYDGSRRHNPLLDHWLAGVAAATVVEYLVETYGRERLPALVDAMRQYRTWDKLVPEVVGVTAEEFQAGWKAYVAVHYAGCTNCTEGRTIAQE